MTAKEVHDKVIQRKLNDLDKGNPGHLLKDLVPDEDDFVFVRIDASDWLVKAVRTLNAAPTRSHINKIMVLQEVRAGLEMVQPGCKVFV